MSPSEFARRRGRLQHRYNFPRALPGCGNVWSAHLVDSWIDAGGCNNVEASPPPLQGEDALVEADRQRLEERYAKH
jgi:hypothetical protein